MMKKTVWFGIATVRLKPVFVQVGEVPVIRVTEHFGDVCQGIFIFTNQIAGQQQFFSLT
jgi:hypothetical protein